MKAIIEIELEMDGQWLPADRDKLIDMIMDNPGHGGWNIDEDRLVVFAKSISCRLLKTRKEK
jgi:hypothetical protein